MTFLPRAYKHLVAIWEMVGLDDCALLASDEGFTQSS